MSILPALLSLIDTTLHLEGRGLQFDPSTRLLGALPELDSVAVLHLLSAIEQEFAIRIADDEVSAELFASVDSLQQFIVSKKV